MDNKTTAELRAELERRVRERMNHLLPGLTDLDSKAHDNTERLIEKMMAEEPAEETAIRRLLEQDINRTVFFRDGGWAARPRMHLRQLMEDMPNLSNMVNGAMFIREKTDRKYWPEWCFIPQGAWAAIQQSIHGKDFPIHKGIDRLLTIAPWRYSQGVYLFEPEIFDALVNSDIPDKLPTDVFLRLPEWSIYIPTPELTFYGGELYGFFASLAYVNEWGGGDDGFRPCLYITTDTEMGLLNTPIYLIGEDVVTAIKTALNNIETDGLNFADLAEELTPLISLTLYICGDEPEIDNTRNPGTSPYRAQGRKIKGTYKIFPASNPTVWTIGQKISETLRRAGHGGGGGMPGHTKRPHIRRAHFHHFWRGPRDGERTLSVKWIPPTFVGVKNEDETEKNAD